MMKIKQLKGNNPSIIQLIGPYAMNGDVIREFKGYPILTDDTMIWFVASEGEIIRGFAALKPKGDSILFTNDYTVADQRGKGINFELIKNRVDYCKKNGYTNLIADCTKMSVGNYLKAGFKVIKEYKDWTKVEMNL